MGAELSRGGASKLAPWTTGPTRPKLGLGSEGMVELLKSNKFEKSSSTNAWSMLVTWCPAGTGSVNDCMYPEASSTFMVCAAAWSIHWKLLTLGSWGASKLLVLTNGLGTQVWFEASALVMGAASFPRCGPCGACFVATIFASVMQRTLRASTSANRRAIRCSLLIWWSVASCD